MRSTTASFLLAATALTFGALAPSDTSESAAPLVRHPHFPKTIEVQLDRNAVVPDITVRFQTATFDEQGFAGMEAGGAWHLAGARIGLGRAMKIGGHQVAAGSWNLMAVKRKDEGWDLALAPITRRGFGTARGADAKVLTTKFRKTEVEREHLQIDVHPAGSASETKLRLEVWFGHFLATSEISMDG